MKEGWEYKKLDEVCYVEYGTRVVQKKDGGTIYPVYGGGGETFRMDRFNRSDSIVIARFAMSKQCTRFVKGKFFLNDSGLTIRSKVDKIAQDFLNWHIIALNDEIYLLGKGMAQKNLDMPSFRNITLKIPPLSEQQHIVEELDLLSSIIEKKKAQLNELDNLAQSLFYEMFGDPITNEKGWEVRKLADISKEKLSYGSGTSAIPYDGKMRYIRITDINDSGELNDNIVSPNSFNEKYLLNDGDILFARSGATVGKTYYHKVKNGKCIYAGYLIRLIPNADIVLPSYVFGYTKTQYYMEFVKSAQNAVAQPNINAKQYGNLDICIPPLSLQQQFTSKIEAIEHQKELIKLSVKEVETLFNSRMDYYFN